MACEMCGNRLMIVGTREFLPEIKDIYVIIVLEGLKT